MGYHERIYRFAVDEVVWTRTRAEQTAVRRGIAKLNERLAVDMSLLDWAGAQKALAKVVEGTHDAGLDSRGLASVEDYLRRMLILERQAGSWSEADQDVVAETLMGVPVAAYKELKKGAREKLLALVATWPEATRVALGPKVIAAWKALQYRFQRNNAKPVLLALDLPATRAFAVRLSEAEANVAAAKERLAKLQATDDYQGLLDVLKALQEDLDLVLDYELAEGQTKHWVPAARRLAALKVVREDPEQREALLTAQIRETVGEGSGLPNSHKKPRYNPEVIQRFVPLLSTAERERIETMLLEIAKSLRPSEDWKQVLLVAELLSGFGGERTRAYFPKLLRRSARQPSWQREHLQRFAAAVGGRR